MKTTRLRGFLSKDLCGLKVNLLAPVGQSAKEAVLGLPLSYGLPAS